MAPGRVWPGMAQTGQNGSEGPQIYTYVYMNWRGSERLWPIVARWGPRSPGTHPGQVWARADQDWAQIYLYSH